MKKTLVAVAAMAAVTGAMANVTISGSLDAAYTTNTATNAAGAASSTTSVAPSGAGQSQITFGVSEDLGNGMKAFANMRFIPDVFGAVAAPVAPATTESGGVNSDVSEVGLSGAFGTIQLEKGYGIDFMIHAAADASGWTGGSKGVVNNTSGTPGNAVVYVLPTMVQGLGVVVARGLAGGASGNGDASVYKLTYSTGGLSVQYAGGSFSHATTSGQSTDFGMGGTTATAAVITIGSKTSLTGLAVTYDLGMAKLHYGSFSRKNSTDVDLKNSSNMMGVSVPFGATTVGFTSSSAKRNTLLGATTKATGYRGKVSYALSKRTTAYGAFGTESVSGTQLKDRQTAFGLTHSF